ncbi:ArsR family transcriptional regulator [Thermococcus sp. CX2]|uniref:ArsR family transcriptional regulator n=1 Tax=Thermococcus piezophilus TaxID=1712654 RepID=A0A172WHY1_9EURY|nr:MULTISPECIES: ArsR family transcriptional regulator [Thermococcus]ANF23057.1 ArsR family transcriptional regulator [Thermococcus piezophilus]NJE84735.1 ArsR family transcriptional regulator [Thermococcus sp. CX2]
MKNVRVMKALEEGPKTIEEIVEATKLPKMEVRRYLLRFLEQGKVESYQKNGKLFWKIKEKDEKEEEFKYV